MIQHLLPYPTLELSRSATSIEVVLLLDHGAVSGSARGLRNSCQSVRTERTEAPILVGSSAVFTASTYFFGWRSMLTQGVSGGALVFKAFSVVFESA